MYFYVSCFDSGNLNASVSNFVVDFWCESDIDCFLESQKQEILSTFLINLVKLTNNFGQYRNIY